MSAEEMATHEERTSGELTVTIRDATEGTVTYRVPAADLVVAVTYPVGPGLATTVTLTATGTRREGDEWLLQALIEPPA